MITVTDILSEFQSFKDQVDAYYAIIAGEVDADANLDGLTSTSKTSEFNLWMWLFSGVTVIANGVWEERQTEIQTIADSAIPGTERWLQKEILKFQYGDTLSFDNITAKYFYAVIDATKQIIARCAITSQGTISTVKAAKLVSGSPVALSGAELTSLRSFVNQIKWAGMQLLVVSQDADLLNAPMTIYYNGIVPLAVMQAAVEQAYTDYLAALPFNGQYSIIRHIDAIQAVENVNDVVIGVVQAKPTGGAYLPVVRIYNPAAGYIVKDPGIAFSALLTYVAQ